MSIYLKRIVIITDGEAVMVGLVYPQIIFTDLDDLICKMNLVVGALSVATYRITSSAWKRSNGGMVRPRA
jgi:hypothetical protein